MEPMTDETLCLGKFGAVRSQYLDPNSEQCQQGIPIALSTGSKRSGNLPSEELGTVRLAGQSSWNAEAAYDHLSSETLLPTRIMRSIAFCCISSIIIFANHEGKIRDFRPVAIIFAHALPHAPWKTWFAD